MTTFTVTVQFNVQAPDRQQAERFVQTVAVDPFRFSRRGTGRIVREKESDK